MNEADGPLDRRSSEMHRLLHLAERHVASYSNDCSVAAFAINGRYLDQLLMGLW